MDRANANHLSAELEWLVRVLKARVKSHFKGEEEGQESFDSALNAIPTFDEPASVYSQFIKQYELTPSERLIIMLAIAPYIRPQILDIFLTIKRENGREITEFGGLKLQDQPQFIPTVETALFVIAGNDLSRRFAYQRMFMPHHQFFRHGILKLEPESRNRQFLTTHILRPTDEIVELFTFGEPQPPGFSSGFPAKRISTRLDWEDLILNASTIGRIEEIQSWILHGEKIMETWGMARILKPGYRSLFYGPPGTGKTLTASLLGKKTGRDVYRIDLSMVVSKYIGETEKNLAQVFDRAEHKDWILFFDEADALFGKRSQVRDAHDRFANQEVSFLLQRVEEFDGVVILASNLKDNLDDAFARRFQSIVHFPMPGPEERHQLWKRAIPAACELAPSVSLAKIAQSYEMSGGSIINVIRYAVLKTATRGDNIILANDLQTGIQREFKKYGKLM